MAEEMNYMRLPVDPGNESKISTEFAARLARMDDDEMVRAIVLPATRTQTATGDARSRSAQRAAAIANTRRASERVFDEIDAQLAQSGGRRVTQRPNSLGFIVVETTPKGVEALADMEWVSAVVEDQPIRQLRRPIIRAVHKSDGAKHRPSWGTAHT